MGTPPYYKAAGKNPNYVQCVAKEGTEVYVWMIGPEKGKALGAFYSPDQNPNPVETKNWHVCKPGSMIAVFG